MDPLNLSACQWHTLGRVLVCNMLRLLLEEVAVEPTVRCLGGKARTEHEPQTNAMKQVATEARLFDTSRPLKNGKRCPNRLHRQWKTQAVLRVRALLNTGTPGRCYDDGLCTTFSPPFLEGVGVQLPTPNRGNHATLAYKMGDVARCNVRA